MRSLKIIGTVVMAGLLPFLTGCNNAQRKLSRGLSNLGEPLRLGELQRSAEQNAISGDATPSYGVVHGLSRTFARTFVGAFEVVTFPIPTDPIIHPVAPVFPDSQERAQMGHFGVGSDQFIGFQDSAVLPMFPGSEFNPLQN